MSKKPKQGELPALVFEDSSTGEPFTTSDIIAEHTGNSYRSIQRTIENQIERLEKFGIMRFKIALSGKAGRPKKVYHLNEEQATLLITFLKNTDVVADFKVELVRQFFEMRRLLQERQSAQWQQARAEGKATRRLETDAVKAFVAYATDNGSQNAQRYYISLTRLAHKAVGVDDGERDQLSTAQLLNLRMTEQVIDQTIWRELTAGTEYHEIYRRVKIAVQQFVELALAPRPALPRATPPTAQQPRAGC